MSKSRLLISITANVGLLIVAGAVGAWAFPLRAPAQTAAPSRPAGKEISPHVITAIQPVKEVPIVYPPLAQAAGIAGKVRLRVAINTDGSVEDLVVLSGHPVLVKPSLESVAKWRYSASKEERVTIVTIVFAHPQNAAVPLSRPAAEKLPSRPLPSLKPVSTVPPVYPPAAKVAGIEGRVTMRVDVDKDGKVTNIRVLSGPPELVKAALDAVRQWRYAPTDKPAITDVTVDFTL
jgi:TonB family protein